MRNSLTDIVFASLAALIWVLGPNVAPSQALEAHPMDGPHADLRLSIDGQGVTFQIGLNLAFIDEAVSVPREALEQIVELELQALEEALRAHVANDIPVRIDGETIEPVIQRYDFFSEPEPWMIGAFPTYGNRALMRAAMVVRYDSPDPQIVEVTWPTYPRDRVAAAMEGMTGPDGGAPFMVFECLLQTSDGLVEIVNFSDVKPTIEWYADESGDSRYEFVPAVPSPSEPVMLSLLGLALLLTGLPAAVILSRKNGALPGAVALAGAIAGGVAGAIVLPMARVGVPGTGGALVLPSNEGVAAIFEPLHGNLYKAFDYGSEEEIYDALERSVSGPLLRDLYTQVYNSLVQAEQGGMLGIITGVDPMDLSVQSIAVGEDGRARIDVLHRWQFEGTVYHWGHRPTRVHAYQAPYTLAGLNEGWRIVDQQMRQQRRLDDDGMAPAAAPEAF